MKDIVPLDEIDLYVLFKEHEDIFLFEKDTNTELWRTSMIGGATYGKIGLVNDWVVIGGKILIVWFDSKLKIIEDPDLNWLHDLRQIGDDEVEILIDPWSEKSAIWRFSLKTSRKIKVRDFKDYRNQEYTDSVIW